jgi:hypothetical protein
MMVTPAQMHALAQINRLAADPSGVLPASAWTDRTIRPYIPSQYYLGWDRSAPDPSKLPSPAKEALQPLLGQPDGVVTTDQARTLLAAFVRSGVKVIGNHAEELDFELPAVSIPTTVLAVRPALPSSPLEARGQCWDKEGHWGAGHELFALHGRSDQWTARLVPEPGNRHDPNAVAVQINGQTVGYVAGPQAVTVAPQLQALARRGCAVEFPVVLVGGDEDRRNIGVFPVD